MGSVYRTEELSDVVALDGAVVAMGVFDGLHKGHRSLIERMVACARDAEARSFIITFSIDPDELFATPGFKKIMSNEERIAHLSACKVDDVIVLDFNEVFASLEPDVFLERLFATHTPRDLFVGEGFRFGCHARGGFDDLLRWGDMHGMDAHEVELICLDGTPISSTRIRALLEDGCIEGANELIGHDYMISGIVEQGAQQGREMGIRTANLSIPDDELALKDGVYAAWVDVAGKRYRAALSIGIPPTFVGERISNVEAHLIDFEGDLYGQKIKIFPKQYLREMKRFDSTEELIACISRDIALARDIA